MTDIKLVDSSNWDALVTNSDKPVLVDFSMKGCGPCQTLKPRLRALYEQQNQVLTVVECKIENSMELAEKYSIRSVPTLKLFVDGDVVKEHVGLLDKAELDDFVDL